MGLREESNRLVVWIAIISVAIVGMVSCWSFNEHQKQRERECRAVGGQVEFSPGKVECIINGKRINLAEWDD